MRKLSSFLLCGFMSLGFLGLAACGDKKDDSSSTPSGEITLIDFEDKSVSVELGDVYTLPNVATDSNDKDYPVTYSVITADGEGIAINQYDFAATELGGYIVTCTVILSNGQTETRTITVTVQDTVAPAIEVSRAKTGYVGEEYTLPAVTTSDVSGAITPEVKLYFVNGDEKTEVAVADGKFTPDSAGTYEMVVTAKDGSNNVATETVEITVLLERVPETIDANEVVDFDEEEDLDNFLILTEVESKEWVEEFQGETGVVKLTFNRDWPRFSFKPSQLMQAYSKYDYLVIRAYAASGENQLNYISLSEGEVYDKIDYLQYDQWVDYKFDINAFLSNWTDGDLNTTIAKVQMNSTTYEVDGYLYIADIFVESAPAAIEFERYKKGYVGEEYTLPAFSVKGYLGDYQTEAKLYLVDGENKTEVAISDGKFTPATAGTYVYEVATTDALNKTGFNSVEITVLQERVPDVIGANEVVDFDEEEDIDSFVKGGSVEDVEWLEEFEGETGVVKVTINRDWPNFSFKPAQDMSAYADANYIVMKIYAASGTNQALYFMLSEGVVSHRLYVTEYDTWVEYKFNAEAFLAKWSNGELANDAKIFMQASDWQTKGYFYIADIRVEKEPTVDFVEVLDGEVGTEYTLPAITVKNFPGEYTSEMKVYFVEGETETEVTVTDGKFTPNAEGVYRIKVTVSDNVGNSCQASVDFDVFAPAAPDVVKENEVVDFDEKSDMDSFKSVAQISGAEWMREYEGETGVLKVTTTSDWPQFTFVPAQAMANYAGYDYLVMRVWISSANGYNYMSLAEGATISKIESFEYDKWIDLKFDIKAFTGNWTDGELPGTAKIVIWAKNAGVAGTLYISDISVIKVPKVEMANAENGEVGTEYTLPAITVSNFPGEYTTDVKVYLVEGETETEVTVTDGKFTPAVKGFYRIVVTVSDNAGNSCTVTDEFDVMEENIPDVVGADEVIDFDERSDIETLTGGSIESVEWLENYAGETGVAKVTINRDWPNLVFKPIQSMSAYAGYDYITMKIYVASGTNQVLYFKLAEGAVQHQITVEKYDEWVDYKFNIEPFLTYWTDDELPSNARIYMQATDWQTTGCFYIADIRVEKAPDVPRVDEVIDFDEAEDIDTLTGGSIESVEWLENYAGETGVAKVTINRDWPNLVFKPIQSMSAYAGYDYITMKIYVASGTNQVLYFKLAEGAAQHQIMVEKYDEWVEYKFNIEPFLTYWTDGELPSNARIYMQATDWQTTGCFYIADIRVEKQPDVIRADEIVDFDEAADLEAISQKRPEGRMNFEWLESYEGENGVLKIAYNDDCPTFYFTPAQALSAYAKYDYVVIRLYIVGNVGTFHHFGLNEQNSYYDANVTDDGKGGIVYGQWVDYKFPIETLMNNEGNVFFLFYRDPMAEGTIYVSDIRVEKAPDVVRADEILDFDEAEDLETISQKRPEGRMNFEWLESYEGENGVLKIAYNDDCPTFYFTPAQALSAYAKYDYVVIRLYIVGNVGTFHHFGLNEQNSYYDANVTDDGKGGIVYGQWVDYKFPIETLMNNEGNVFFLFYRDPMAEGEIYVADIRVEKEPDVPRADEVVDFDEEEDIANFKKINAAGEWLESYEGENGVLKITTVGDWPQFSFIPAQAMANYAGYDYLVMRVWISSANEYNYMSLAEGATFSKIESFEYDKWIDLKFDINAFTANWADGELPGTAKVVIWGKTTAGSALYISDIYVAKEEVVEPEEPDVPADVVRADEILDFDEAADLEVISQKRPEGRMNFEWLESYEGENGVLKIAYNDDCPTFYFTPAQALSAYAKYDYVVIRLYIVGNAGTFHHFGLNEQNSYYDANVADDGKGGIVYGQWVDYKFPIETLMNSNGNVFFLFYRDPMAEGTIYVSDIRVEKAPDVVRADEILDFDEAEDLEKVSQKRPEGRVNFEWIESYEGENGVLKMAYNDDCPTFYFTPAQALSAYTEYDYVVIRLYIVGNAGTFHHFGLNEQNSYYDANVADDGKGGIVYGQWVDYKFSIETLMNNEGNVFFLFYRDPMAEGTIYVSDIRVEKAAE